jgi:hypothetical protein
MAVIGAAFATAMNSTPDRPMAPVLRWFEPPDPPEPDDPVATVDPLEDVCDVSRLRLSLVATSVSIPGLVQMRPATGPNAPFVAHCSLSVRFDDGQSGGIVAVRLAGDKTPTAWRVDRRRNR